MAKKMFGFTKYRPTNTIMSETKKMADNYIKTNTDEYGEVSNPNIYLEAINLLAPYSDDVGVAGKIADYQNKVLKLETKIEKANNDLTLFNYDLQKTVLEATKDNKDNPSQLIFRLTSIYQLALEDFGGLFDKALENLPKGYDVPDALLNYKEDLDNRFKTLADLSYSYMQTDPTTNLAGPVNPDAYGVFIKTNPQNGSIVNLDIQRADSLSGVPTGYTKTDSRYGRLPIYLNTYDAKGVEQGNLGGITFDYDENDKILKQSGEGILAGIGTFVGESLEALLGEETRAGLKQERQEFPLSAVPFDFYNLPPESVLKDGKGDYYFYDKSFTLWKAKDADTLKRYLEEIGRNPSDVDDRFFLAHPDFISKNSGFDESGKPRVIDESFFSGVGGAEMGGVSMVSSPLAPKPQEFRYPEATMTEAKQGAIDSAKTSSPDWIARRGYDVGRVIEKGKKIFRGITE